MSKPYEFKAVVRIFPQNGGWHYAAVPQRYTDVLKPLADRGLVAVKATIGEYTWDTSLLPMGDGSQFIALPAKVRQKENIALGSQIKISFLPR